MRRYQESILCSIRHLGDEGVNAFGVEELEWESALHGKENTLPTTNFPIVEEVECMAHSTNINLVRALGGSNKGIY
ncbi:unnamed protein product [Heligmosomoides polygyrus]|uniref:Amidohydrolase n=1 Tax=Heligmosomoides polygyrus TaxID=6339 RepID=A0A183FI27_HELPZ|nr:unnamed protein product [Heligmosomoides polygyrus]